MLFYSSTAADDTFLAFLEGSAVCSLSVETLAEVLSHFLIHVRLKDKEMVIHLAQNGLRLKLGWSKKQFHESIFFCLSNSGPQVGLGPIPAATEWRPPWTAPQSVTETDHLHSQSDSQLDSPANLTMYIFGRKQEYPDRTCKHRKAWI